MTPPLPYADLARTCHTMAEVLKARILHSGADHRCLPYWTGSGDEIARAQAESLSRAVDYDFGTIGAIIVMFGAGIGLLYGLYQLSKWRHRRRSCHRRNTAARRRRGAKA